MKKQLLIGSMLIGLTACQTIKTSTAKTIEIENNGIIQKPTVADLEVRTPKVSGTASSVGAETLENVRMKAVSDAIKQANCDLLVEPMYETEKTGSSFKVTVTGYPATHKNFRPITEEDLKLIHVGSSKKVKTTEVTPSSNRSSNW